MTVQTLAYLTILGAAAYLLLLGLSAFLRPARAAAFLGGFAQTLPAHLLELAVRVVIGAALIARAPAMHFSTAAAAFGWILVVTSGVLALLPWRLHQRFARWSVPRATQGMLLIGVGATLAGLAVLAALTLPHAASDEHAPSHLERSTGMA